jgi:phosphatidylserine/phosphatidylglycerophosphate/cardiolipin synthase-like enzyme
MERTHHVQAAVAYASSTDHPLVRDCHARRIRCQVWSRHDFTLPTALPVLEWAAKLGDTNSNFTWKLLGSFYHPKVIWWHSFGVYIGSANLTQAAWFSNSEAGTFIPEHQLEEEGRTPWTSGMPKTKRIQKLRYVPQLTGGEIQPKRPRTKIESSMSGHRSTESSLRLNAWKS